MNKKMITIAEVLFAIIFIVLMATIFNTVSRFGNQANNMILNIQQSIEDSDLKAYDNAIISGDAVRSLVNGMKETRNGTKMSYIVDISGTKNEYGYKAVTTDSTVANAAYDSTAQEISGIYIKDSEASYASYDTSTEITAADFINPVDQYETKLIFNANGVAIGIQLTKKA